MRVHLGCSTSRLCAEQHTHIAVGGHRPWCVGGSGSSDRAWISRAAHPIISYWITPAKVNPKMFALGVSDSQFWQLHACMHHSSRDPAASCSVDSWQRQPSMSCAALRARCATQPQRTERSVASVEDDARHAPGMLAEGDDWSARRHSERTDRPLPREVVRELSRKSDMQVCGRLR